MEARKSTDESHKSESSKLKLALEAKESESEHLRKNNFALADQADRVRKEVSTSIYSYVIIYEYLREKKTKHFTRANTRICLSHFSNLYRRVQNVEYKI